MCLIRIPGEKRENRTEAMFEEIVAKDFSGPMNVINHTFKESYKSTIHLNTT